MLTLGQAAKEVSVSKATLSRAVKSGRISASKNDRGGFDIDPAELFRVFPRNPVTVAGNSPAKQTATHHATDETPILMERIEALKTQIVFLRENAAELKEQRDSWRNQAEQAQRLLAAPDTRRSDDETVKQVQQSVATIQAASEKMSVTLQALVQKIQEPAASVRRRWLSGWFGI